MGKKRWKFGSEKRSRPYEGKLSSPETISERYVADDAGSSSVGAAQKLMIWRIAIFNAVKDLRH